MLRHDQAAPQGGVRRGEMPHLGHGGVERGELAGVAWRSVARRVAWRGAAERGRARQSAAGGRPPQKSQAPRSEGYRRLYAIADVGSALLAAAGEGGGERLTLCSFALLLSVYCGLKRVT